MLRGIVHRILAGYRATHTIFARVGERTNWSRKTTTSIIDRHRPMFAFRTKDLWYTLTGTRPCIYASENLLETSKVHVDTWH